MTILPWVKVPQRCLTFSSLLIITIRMLISIILIKTPKSKQESNRFLTKPTRTLRLGNLQESKKRQSSSKRKRRT